MTTKNLMRGLTRRNFLKGSISLGAGISLFGLTACSPSKPGTTPPVGTDQKGRTLGYHTCPRNCHDTCSLISEKEDGRIVRMYGNPDNPITAGTPCGKGHSHLNVLYHPDRLLYPMKRAGKKGEGKWEKITWDEAYNTIATKFKGIIDEYGSEAIMPYTFSGTFGLVQQFGVPRRFFNKIGASDLNIAVCESAGRQAIAYTYGMFDASEPEDYANTNCFVAWGSNEAYTNVHGVKFINQAREKGAKLVVINPHRNPLASQADIFIQLKPGTDAALALGVANLLIEKGLYDQEFINKYTIGFDKLKEKVKEYPLEKVAEITGVPAKQIEEFVQVYGEAKPSMIRMGYGFQRRTNGGTTCRAISLLPAITGVIGQESGGFSFINYGGWPLDGSYTQGMDLLGDRKVRIINMSELSKAITGNLETTKKLPVKGLFIYSGNPIPSGANVNLIREGLEREDLFTVVFDMFVTDTAEYADILLPAAHFLEVEEVHGDYLGYYARYNEPALEPMGESKSNLEVFHELSKRMGYTDHYFDESVEDVIRNSLLTDKNPVFKDVTYESLKEKHFIHLNMTKFSDYKFPTPSGKIEFYSEKLGQDGFDPVAEWVPDAESKVSNPELYAKYPIDLVTPASSLLLSSQWHNVPSIQEALGEPIIIMHKDDADARGIKGGDYVTVFNNRGEVRLKAQVTSSAVNPGVSCSYKSYWDKLTRGNTINRLASDTIGDMNGISTFSSNLVQIKKA